VYVGYFYAVRGAIGQQLSMDILSHNLANASSPGFKIDRASFEDYLIPKVETDYSQGPLHRTERDLDVALRGPGFLKVLTPEGQAYTRDGSFHIDQDGNLITGEGYRVLGQGGPISLGTDPGAINIDSTGNIRRGQVDIDRLALVELADMTHCHADGGNVIKWKGPGNPQEIPTYDTEVVQGSLEMPNLSVVEGMAGMVEINRAYEAFIKAIQAFHDVDTKAANQVGRLK